MINIVKTGKIPRSVAMIMDGNRRYATTKNQEKHKGHAVGLNKLEETLVWCKNLGIYELTVFALAKENLQRSKVEVDTLMGLCKDQFARLARNGGVFKRQQIRVRVLGDLSLMPDDVAKSLRETERITKDHKEGVLNVCICYNSKDEMDEAMKDQPKTVAAFEKKLHGGYNVKPDIVIRTSGEIRLSNFLLYQSKDSYFAFVDSLWPDFSLWDFAKVIFEYQSVSDL